MSKDNKTYRSKPFWYPIFRTRGILILLFGLIFPSVGIFSKIPTSDLISATLGYYLIFFVLLYIDFFYVLKSVRSISVTYEITPALVSNEIQELTLIFSTGSLSSGYKILIRPQIVSGVKLLDKVKSIKISNDSTKGGVEKVKFKVHPLERGEKEWDKVFLRVSFPISICYWQYQLNTQPTKTTVFPNFSFKNDTSSKPFYLMQVGEYSFNRLGGGREFDYLRNYIPGDDTRKIDWKHTAKSQKLTVKLFKPESHQVINVAIDCSRRLMGMIEGRKVIEHACDGAARLVKFTGRYEDEVGLFAFSNRTITSVPSRKGLSQQNRIVQMLTKINIEDVEPDYQLLTEWAVRKNKRSLLVLITCISNPIAIDAILKSLLPVSRKHLLLVVCIADRELEMIMHQRAENLQDAYIISAAAEQSALIQARIVELNRRGIETLCCDAINLKSELLKKYYRLKAIGKI